MLRRDLGFGPGGIEGRVRERERERERSEYYQYVQFVQYGKPSSTPAQWILQVLCQISLTICVFIIYLPTFIVNVDKKPTRCHFVLSFIFPLQVAQHVSGNHVPIFRSWRLRCVIATCWCCDVVAARAQHHGSTTHQIYCQGYVRVDFRVSVSFCGISHTVWPFLCCQKQIVHLHRKRRRWCAQLCCSKSDVWLITAWHFSM